MIEVETNDVEVEVVGGIEATSTGSVDVEVVDLGELDIVVAKKEYTITGDSIYVPVLYDDAPQWMKDLVGLAVEVSMESANASTIGQLNQMLGEFATSYVPLNQYTQSINDLSDADTSLHSLVTTLNSNFNDGLSEANSQIVGLQSTKASKTEVVTMVIDTIAAQLADSGSDIGAVVANLNQAIVNETTARANSMNVLTAHLNNIDSGVTANATALNNTMAYVGVNSAGAETGTGLSAYLSVGGVVGAANSKVANNVYVDAQGNVKSKYEYNSTVTVNGTNYNSGFGLSNSAGTGIGSEFWVNADKFKFTNNGKTGSKAPFTIDASGSTPQIYFNGVVSFSNIAGTPNYVLAGNAANDVNSNTTTINGGKITTWSITATQIQAGSVTADRLSPTSGTSTVWSGGGLVSQNFNGNTVGNIGSPTAGFRLSSDAAGTSSDPNIYGAFIRGSTLKTSSLAIDSLRVVTDYGTTSPLVFSSVRSFTNQWTQDYSSVLDRVYAPSYSSGYMSRRLCTFTTPIMLDGTVFIDVGDVTLYIEVSYDGGAWSALQSVSQNGNGNTGLATSYVFTPANSGWSYLDIRFRVSGQWSRSGLFKYLIINGA